MLKQLGRLERTRNIVILGFAILMAVSLVFFYAPGRTANTIDATRNTEVVARIGSDNITVAELARRREAMIQQYGPNIASLGGSKIFLDGMIKGRVIVQEADRLGLNASDGELRERLLKTYSDASGQFVGYDRYKESIVARYGDVESYEKEMRNAIASQKLQAFITASVNVSDDDVREEYKRRNTSFDVNYISVSADKLAEKIQPSDEELRTYFESHKNDYRFNDTQRKVRYIFVDQEKAGSKLSIPDEDLKKQFDEHTEAKYKEAGVKVQQIVLKVARQDLDAQAEQKAKDLIARVTNGSRQATEEAFAEAARGNSEDPASARNNGYLSAPFKDNPNKPHGLYSRVTTMTEGDVSDIPIRYGGNWYILRRGASVPKTFEQAKPELLVSARNQRGFSAAFQIATKAKARLEETKDPQKVAQEFAAEANMNPADMVRETGYVKPGDDVPNIGANQQFEQALAALNNPNDVGEPTGIKNGFAIPMLVDKKDPRIPEFDEVKTKVSDAIKQQRAKDQLEQKAKDLLAGLTSADAVKAAGEKEGLDAGYEEGFKLTSTLGKAGTNVAIDDAIYGLKDGEVSKTPIRVDDKWVIVGVVKRIEPDFTAFSGGEQERLKQQLLGARQNQIFEDYISAVEQRMRRDGKIEVYEDVLTRLDESMPAAEPPNFPRGLNFPTGE
jgi:peptidyl-prolyl cis-trans isomerase D